jgi:hypothetical protein
MYFLGGPTKLFIRCFAYVLQSKGLDQPVALGKELSINDKAGINRLILTDGYKTQHTFMYGTPAGAAEIYQNDL